MRASISNISWHRQGNNEYQNRRNSKQTNNTADGSADANKLSAMWRNPGDINRSRQQQNRRRGCNQRPNNRDQYSTSYFNFTRLDEMSKMNSDDVVTIIAKKKIEFEGLLHNITTSDLLVVTLRVLVNVCQANFAEIVTHVLSHACSTIFLKSLEVYLTKLPFETPDEKIKNKLYHENKNLFWSNLMEFFKRVVELLPSKARDELTSILQKINLISEVIEKSQGFKMDEQIKKTATNLSEELEAELQKINKKNAVCATIDHVPDVEDTPPEDFRLMSVIPTIGDLYDHQPFIRPCKIKDRYNSVEHYLDVQFRLLREDFVSPLRSGIQEYLHGPLHYRSNELQLYKKVILVSPEVIKNNVGIGLFFGIMKGINWARSKKFIYGGLLLLSKDNFNTILFVTVANRSEEQLKKGYISIEPCQGTRITRDMYDTEFVMLESKIYFEPYFAVLTALQNMNVINFPMENYMVNVDAQVTLPNYLRPGDVLKYGDFRLPIGEDQQWPSAEYMKLDETQYNAFKCALTQEFALIQGPPGTGKTFIALKIVRTLLENQTYWQDHGPIVVVCFTNHALDQFLEGILRYTSSIVRIGTRSQNETLKPYTLMERRKSSYHLTKTDARAVLYDTKHELEEVVKSMQRKLTLIKYLTTPDAIVPLSCLRQYCSDRSLLKINSNEELINWLVGSNVILLPESSLPPQTQEDLSEITVEDKPEHEQNRDMDDELELDCDFKVDDSEKLFFPLRHLDAMISQLNQQILEYRSHSENHSSSNLVIKWKEHLNILTELRFFLQRKLSRHPLLIQQHYPPKNPRWKLYWRWVMHSYNNLMNRVAETEAAYRQINSRLHEAKQLVDLSILKLHQVIGLTTSAAAKLHASLSALHAPIVLVEEAAEILEAHVVCSMTKHCKHVILIGDHKQLRPKPSVYKLGTKYNLNISLFERMVNIRGNCVQLRHQHRMRPEIAQLITPSIYETLYNHNSVLNYPAVKGLEKNLFFLNHNNRETNRDTEQSWANQHEAVFLVAFARHLILQGYDGTEITILCTYTGQLFALMQERKRYAILKQVRITSVDNYQGEENKIILLSLVRSNGQGNIGFLKEENRVCVALSRAREGLYIMGNMDDLLVNNNIWPKIKEVLEDESAIGDTLALRCQIHSDQLTLVQNPIDFQQCPEGGCSKKCNLDLLCGHTCTSVCHTTDRKHEEFQCKQPCVKSCPNDHPCTLKCFEDCGPCKVIVERQIKCEHTVKMECSMDPEKFSCYVTVDAILPDCHHDIKKSCSQLLENCKCQHTCENRLPCGHSCGLTCHVNDDPDHIEYECSKDCTNNNLGCVNNHPCMKRCFEECIPCPIIVAKRRSCGHYFKKVKCADDIENQRCLKVCKRLMSCGHTCQGKCFQDCGNCQEKVNKTSSCGHTLKVKCCEKATPSKCNFKCPRQLNCGHPCTARCKDPCTTTCQEMVPLTERGLCGHIFSVPCYLKSSGEYKAAAKNLLKYCKEPCRAPLACTHLCGGTCGQCKQGRIHQPCNEPCGNILICGHKCDVPCRQGCQPCNKPCKVACQHSKCNKKCGIPCTPCKEICSWGCTHRKCTKRCFQLCDIDPCNEPCNKMLKCNHPCVGFCGDPCPPLCRICNKEELTEVFLGDEDEPDARFVFLEDCRHCIESEGLSTWLTKSSGSIQMKCCPRCKTPIRKCMRIMNRIKEDLEDVLLVKSKVFGKQSILKNQQREYVGAIEILQQHYKVTEFPVLMVLLNTLWNNAIPVKRRRYQILSAQEVEALRIISDIVRHILDVLTPIKKRTTNSYGYVTDQVATLVESIPIRGQISNQELHDITQELNRLDYMVKICVMESEVVNQQSYHLIMQKLLGIVPFTSIMEDEIKMDIKASHHIQVATEERKMIVKAMGFKPGHWYKCPNGHIYAIADCGGANQESRCNECGEAIGGMHHRLTSGNSLAPEMDSATHSAWPGMGM